MRMKRMRDERSWKENPHENPEGVMMSSEFEHFVIFEQLCSSNSKTLERVALVLKTEIDRTTSNFTWGKTEFISIQ